MVFFTGLLNSISEIGFPDWCSQLVLSKKLCQNKKATRKVAPIQNFGFTKVLWTAGQGPQSSPVLA
jgi:hypothetical protein